MVPSTNTKSSDSLMQPKSSTQIGLSYSFRRTGSTKKPSNGSQICVRGSQSQRFERRFTNCPHSEKPAPNEKRRMRKSWTQGHSGRAVGFLEMLERPRGVEQTKAEQAEYSEGED